ncbi:MAG: hypothetical protein ABI855_19895 [Bacteroidota bacterium]
MNYDSEEGRKHQQSIAEKLKLTREFMNDPQKVKIVTESIEKLHHALQPLLEKINCGEKLDEQENDLFKEGINMLFRVKQSFEDMQLLLGNNLVIQSDAIFFHLKKLAEEGNPEAKKAYERLVPLFKDAHGENLNSPERKN